MRFLVLSMPFLWISLSALPLRAQTDRDVVSINGTVIRQSEVMDRLWKRYGPGTLEEMIDEILLQQAAKNKGLKTDPQETEKRFQRVKNQFSNPAVFENQLRQSGSSEEKLKAEIAEQILMRQLIVSQNKISISDEALMKAFEDNKDKLAEPPAIHLRHILVKTEAEAKEIEAKVKQGADFTALAKERSLAPTGKLTGGDYGMVSRGMLPKEIDDIAFGMKSDELRILPSPKGFHVLQVLKKRPAQAARFAAVKEDLRDMLLEEKMKEILPEYLQELRKKADIKSLGMP